MKLCCLEVSETTPSLAILKVRAAALHDELSPRTLLFSRKQHI